MGFMRGMLDEPGDRKGLDLKPILGNNDGPKKKHISLGFLSSSDVRQPKQVQIMVQNDEWGVDLLVRLSAEQFTSLMSGQGIVVDAEIG